MLAKWPPYLRHRVLLSKIPQAKSVFSIEFVIPIGIKSMVNEVNNKQTNRNGKNLLQSSFDGSESSYARLKDDAYYHSQVAVGDPIRSKRTKRTHRKEIQNAE